MFSSFHEVSTTSIPYHHCAVDPLLPLPECNSLALGASILGINQTNDPNQIADVACQAIASGAAEGLEAETVLASVLVWCNAANIDISHQASLLSLIEALSRSIDSQKSLIHH